MSSSYKPLGASSPSLHHSMPPVTLTDSEHIELDGYGRTLTRSPSPQPQTSSEYDSFRYAGAGSTTNDIEAHGLIKGQQDPQVYRLYKRRWFGLVLLTIQSFAIGWGFTAPSVVAETAIEWFGITFETLNYLSIVGNLVFLAPAPFVIWILNRLGPKWSIVASCCLTVLGSWIIYAGTHAHDFETNLAGVIIHSLASPFVICAPTRYSRQWFGDGSRTLATAIPSLAYPLGAGFGALTGPYMLKPLGTLNYDSQALIIALVFTAVALPAPFLPSRPPSPPSTVAAANNLTLKQNIMTLARNKPFFLQLATFSILAGTIDAALAVTVQAIMPYGYTQQDGAAAIAILIFVGIGASFIVAPILDKTKLHEKAIKVFVVIVAIIYTGLPWVPQSRSKALLYFMYSLIGIFMISLEPTILEYQASITHPVSPEFSSAICWCGCKVIAAVFTILVGDVLVSKKPEDGQPKGSLFNGLLLVAGTMWVVVLCSMFTGVWIFKRPEASKVKGNT